MRAYCTYFDSHYLAQGIVMLRSLLRSDPGSAIHVLAFDEPSLRILRETFSGAIQVTAIEQFHAAKPEIEELRASRSTWAFYATHKPAFVRWVMQSSLAPASVTFVDADMCYFSGPGPVYREIGEAEIVVSPHLPTPSDADFSAYGIFNAGWIYWRNSDVGERCVADWERQCIGWCAEDVLPDGRFMNQGYLNAWPDRYAGVHVLRHPGVNLGPWNLSRHFLKQHAGISVDAEPLICYHFSGLRRHASGAWYSTYPKPRQFRLAQNAIYRPYLEAVEAERASLLAAHGLEGTGTVRASNIAPEFVRVDRPAAFSGVTSRLARALSRFGARS